MKVYEEFHGNMVISKIDSQLRQLVKREKKSFKILTGYGSTGGFSNSKSTALKSLAKLLNEGLIKGYFPGEVKNNLLNLKSPYYDSKLKFEIFLFPNLG